MDHHVDIDVRPDPETAPHQLMNALYSRLHRALVTQRTSQIGVSFPGLNATAQQLGTRLRLHGSLQTLQGLLDTDWLNALRDHLKVHPPAPVPAGASHRLVHRVQTKSSPERLRRRQMRRHGYDEGEATRRIPDSSIRLTSLPFVQIHSASTDQTFRLFIQHGPLQPQPAPGSHNAYGLSHTATVPWF